MKVMTFNLRTDFVLDRRNRWKHRSQVVYETIKQNKCDIVGVQEMNNQMLKDISDNIPYYDIIGEARTKKFFIERNDILVSKKHEILEYNTFWLSNNQDKVGSSVWYSLYPRICTTALIKLQGGKIIRVYNTHLDCFLPHARQFGLKKIGKYIEKQYEKEKVPIILMGDFNATPNSKVIDEFKNCHYHSKKLVAVQEVNKNIYGRTTMSNFKGKEKGIHIDYIFVSEEFKINNAEIITYHEEGRYPSDHYPMIAEIEI